jgi:hypothetical protein
MTNPEWLAHAYPLKSITIKLQGTKHSTLDAMINQLNDVADRIKAGDFLGYEHDDDFGYWFEVADKTDTSIFDTSCGRK